MELYLLGWFWVSKEDVLMEQSKINTAYEKMTFIYSLALIPLVVVDVSFIFFFI